MQFDSRYAVFVALMLTGCGKEAEHFDPPPPPVAPLVSETCGHQGFLTASLSGALEVDLDWRGKALQCESMRRPDDRGLRLRFTGDVSGERLGVIIAMPDLDPGDTGSDFDSLVTIIVDGSGRFFSTANLTSCWTEVRDNELQADNTYVVAGILTCVSPLGEYNGSAFIDVRDLQFSGIADWNAT